MAAAPPRRVIGGRWELDKQIGKGSFAVVWRAREVPEGARVAPDREATGGPREVPPAPPTASSPRSVDDASFSYPGRLPGTSETGRLPNCDDETEVESMKNQKSATVFQKDPADADDAAHSAPDSSTRWVAVKEICTRRLNRKLLRSLESEIDVLRACRHTNIIALLDIIKDEPNQTVFLVLEHCEQGDVSEFLKRNGRVAEKTARTFARQIAGGLREMRARNLIHRDLKPQNLLLCCEKKNKSDADATEEVTLKIADFGFARYVHPSGLAETLCGSPLYMAPEILSYQKYDAKADLWSVGCILFELVCGKPPFTGANPMQLLRNITRSDARVPGAVATTLSSECVDLMRGLLQKDPSRRMSFEQFFDHPFLATETHQAPMRMARGLDERKAKAPAPSLAAGADSDSDASESEALGERDPRAIALGTDADARPGDAEAPRVSASPKEKKFSLPAAAERARDAAAAAGAWLGSSPLARGGSTFSKLLSSSPLSAKKGSLASFSSSPRGTRPPRTPAKRECFEGNERGEAEDMDAEYVLVETDVSRNAGSSTPALKKGLPDASASRTKKTKTKTKVSPVLSSERLRRAALLERAARALRDAAGEKWDAGDRLDAVALSLAATAALRRAAALAEAARRAAAAEGDDDDAEEVAEASRRLDAAFEAALRRAERAASAAETRVARTRSPSSSDPDDLGSRDASFSDADADVVPDGMRATYAAALGWGRAAAAAELVGDAREAASTYARAHVLLSFLLSEGPDFCAFDERDACRTFAPAPAPESTAGPGPDDGGSPASAWRSAEERGRVARFADAFAARRAACLERGGV